MMRTDPMRKPTRQHILEVRRQLLDLLASMDRNSKRGIERVAHLVDDYFARMARLKGPEEMSVRALVQRTVERLNKTHAGEPKMIAKRERVLLGDLINLGVASAGIDSNDDWSGPWRTW